jgi:glutamine amidotransferase
MLHKLGHKAIITDDRKKIAEANKIILPGVGSFDTGVEHLRSSGIWDVLNKTVLEGGVPLLGICLGMQIISKGSQEGVLPGFGWIDASFKKFPPVSPTGQQLRVPNIGWNHIRVLNNEDLCAGLPPKPRFYFVHSYYPELGDPAQAFITCDYNGFEYVCAYRKSNIWGVQFHPEKSHIYGMQLLKNFSAR